jgi:1,4-alpha-glucan branching enzyme
MSDPAGDLAIVLHSHMPYVEGFGTYPFGEEWLFDAVIRSHLPVLEVARDLTMTVTPVLADQLEAEGVKERLREFLDRHRIGAALNDVETADADHVPAARAELARYEGAATQLDRFGGEPLAAFAAAAGRNVSLVPSSATHAVLPLLATRAGLDAQVETGLASHRRRFGPSAGFWLPECAYRPGLEHDLARHGIEWFCIDQSPFEEGDAALAPVATEGPLAFTIDWPAISWLWDMSGYPSWPGYLDFHRLSMNGLRIFRIDGGPYDAEAAANRAAEQAGEFLAAARDRLDGYRRRTGRMGLMTFAIDCELLGHWWSEGPLWLAAVLDRAEEEGVRLVTLDEAAREHGDTAREVPLRASTWGEKKDFHTWDSPAVADLAWAARSLELRVGEAIAGGLPRDRAERAVRELLMVQSSDWAFLDQRGQAGDYPFERATGHAENAFEALQSSPANTGVPIRSRLRGLAPDLSITPFLTP